MKLPLAGAPIIKGSLFTILQDLMIELTRVGAESYEVNRSQLGPLFDQWGLHRQNEAQWTENDAIVIGMVASASGVCDIYGK